jgi:hypothetical protein
VKKKRREQAKRKKERKGVQTSRAPKKKCGMFVSLFIRFLYRLKDVIRFFFFRLFLPVCPFFFLSFLWAASKTKQKRKEDLLVDLVQRDKEATVRGRRDFALEEVPIHDAED